MAYQKLNWLNKGEIGAIPINKTNLNHMDDGIKQNSNDIANIIESGSNNNGSWIKYSDGTLIQYGEVTKSLTITNKSDASGWFYDDGYIINFPILFSDINYFVDVKAAMPGLITLNVYSITEQENRRCKFNLSSNINYNNPSYKFRWFAIGKWK